MRTQQSREYRKAATERIPCKHMKAHLPASSSVCPMGIKFFSQSGVGSAWKVTLVLQEAGEMWGKSFAELSYHTLYLEQLRLKHSLLLTLPDRHFWQKSKKDTWRQQYLKLLEARLQMLICQSLTCSKNIDCSPVVNKQSRCCMVSIEAAGASSGSKGDEQQTNIKCS